jgi:hypothetical protein
LSTPDTLPPASFAIQLRVEHVTPELRLKGFCPVRRRETVQPKILVFSAWPDCLNLSHDMGQSVFMKELQDQREISINA